MTTQNAINWPERRPPAEGVPGRLSRTAEAAEALQPGDAGELPGGGLLTQETRIGEPAAALAQQRPDPSPNRMLNGHHAWLDGLVRAASGKAG
ncbi:hypothetical protein [Streptomyces sp. HUAS ZL42]|uniref:hypothetical protein n=1 Tax=Streptomyces sp. HUAS ZL42 TaxID=3231715 RepID=UPI00345E3A07